MIVLFQINGVEMAYASHDQAVALLTSSRDIHLIVFRESMEVEHHEPIVSKYRGLYLAIMSLPYSYKGL